MASAEEEKALLTRSDYDSNLSKQRDQSSPRIGGNDPRIRAAKREESLNEDEFMNEFDRGEVAQI